MALPSARTSRHDGSAEDDVYRQFAGAMERHSAADAAGNGSASSVHVHEERVEVNQRALIDKILARYATAGAVYRELLQNSNDANATAAEIYFATASAAAGASAGSRPTVESVTYRNNGMPFRPQDWARLKKIAEGNPDESKIGAFGVGAYSIFSICEQPIVVSGTQALAFVWKGDALWTRTMNRDQVETAHQQGKPVDTTWTSFLMPSRDPYRLPDLQEFGQFLCSSLTFTKNLRAISVYVNDDCRLHIHKTMVEPPRPIQIPKSAVQASKPSSSSSSSTTSSSSVLSSIWSMATSTAIVPGTKPSTALKSHPNGLFSLKAPKHTPSHDTSQPNDSAEGASFLDSKYHFQVTLDGSSASMLVRYIVAIVSTHIPPQLEKRMERVTKKKPPSKLEIQMVFNGQQRDVNNNNDDDSIIINNNINNNNDSGSKKSDSSRKARRRHNKALSIVHSVSPPIGAGRIFIGFKTSQTTGLAAHLAAPFVPTVEREAMDLQDPALRQFNLELLELSGRCMRLVLEHGMMMIGMEYVANAERRQKWQQQYLLDIEQKKRNKAIRASADGDNSDNAEDDSDDENDDAEDDDDTVTSASTASSSMWGFAKFMAKGVKKRVVKVLNTVEEVVGNVTANETAELLHPNDPFPLCMEEREAITLMQAFLPQQSTPDPTVGTTLAQGFMRCLPDQAPPVLTQSGGVVPGSVGKLPNNGMEAFCSSGTIVRNIVYENAQDYHSVVAQCAPVTLTAVHEHLSSTVLPRDKFVRFCKWWVAYSRLNASTQQETRHIGYQFKEAIRFAMDADGSSHGANTEEAHRLSDYLFYWDPNIIRSAENIKSDAQSLPMPETMLPKALQDDITLRTLSDKALTTWLAEPLPFGIWMEYVSYHPSMTSGQAAYDGVRSLVLATIHQEYMRRRSSMEQRVFGEYCANLLRNKRCLPFDSPTPTDPATIVADCPANLYLASAELKAFSEIDSDHFRKVAAEYFTKGILSEQFCVALGVRESVSIDFLFANLETLQWSTNPKPLVEYLRSAVYSKQDLAKLQTSSYLPCESDASRMFAPHELYIPKNKVYRHLAETGIIRLLQWPEDELTETTPNGRYLVDELGMQNVPPLMEVLHCVANMIANPQVRVACLEYVETELKPHSGIYSSVYSKRMSKSQRASLKIMPCVVQHPIEKKTEDGLFFSPIHCCASQQCSIMGFPVLDGKLLGKDRLSLFASRFEIVQDPSPMACIQQFQNLVKKAKAHLDQSPDDDFRRHIITVFDTVFAYLSSRCSDMNASMLAPLHTDAFIPILDGDITWYRHDQVFFKRDKADSTDNSDDIHASLFPMVSFSPFLASAGVKHEASTKDLFRLVLESPQQVLELGEDKYRMLLRRFAADPPFNRLTRQIQQTPFLLAYAPIEDGGDEKKGDSTESPTVRVELAKAEDVFIIDNSFLGRMFSVKHAPQESDLEEFYAKIGSHYISKVVQKKFDVIGESPLRNTKLILTLQRCLEERSSLLVSPSITSRPLVDKAAIILDTKTHLQIRQAKELKAIFMLGKSIRTKTTTCCALPVPGINKRHKNTLYITQGFDWFDVGYAIGELILKRCQLEDAFFISSLLDAPLDQLRARGFPVDRIIQPKPITIPKKVESVQTERPGAAAVSNDGSVASAGPTVAQIPPAATKIGTGTEAAKPASAAAARDGSTSHTVKAGSSLEQQAEKAEPEMSPDDYVRVLKQMFPDADEAYLRRKLGPNPTLDDLRVLADILAAERDPNQGQGSYSGAGDRQHHKNHQHHINDDDDSSSVRSSGSKVLGSKKLGRMFEGLRRNNPTAGLGNAGAAMASKLGQGLQAPGVHEGGASGGSGGMAGPAGGRQVQEDPNRHHTPQSDASAHLNMERMLQNTVGKSSKVNANGISEPERHASIPEGLDRGNSCEVIAGRDLKPFVSTHPHGNTHNSIRVFSARQHPSSEEFLRANFGIVESFAVVLERLGRVYDMDLSSIAIFHDPTGGTIAFNASRALYFNVRFFNALHYMTNKHQSHECYSYWYIVIAHELAHHIVSTHNKEHGFYTESYAALFLPKLVSLMTTLEG